MLNSDALHDAIKRVVSSMLAGQAQHRHAVISSVNPVDHTVKVMIQPEGVLSGWIPCGTVGVGAASLVIPPNEGDQVLIAPADGNADHWRVVSRIFDDTNTVPVSPITGKPPVSGEVGIFANGAYLHMSGGTIYLAGDVHVDGEIYDRHGSLDRLRQHYDQHVHGGVKPGSSNTATTSAPDAE